MVHVLVLVLSLGVIVAAIVATMRRIDVRLVLLTAALVIGLLAGCDAAANADVRAPMLLGQAFVRPPMEVVRKFLATLVAEQFVVPICSAMGFAHILRLTQCDQHLVRLLIRPLQRVRFLLVPGTVLVGFLVNIAVISQTSTAVCIGAVLIPLLLAARVPPAIAGASLLLGASIGGELLNPGAPEINTIAKAAGGTGMDVVERLLGLNLLHLGLTTVLFWASSAVFQARVRAAEPEPPAAEEPTEDFRVNYVKALIPLAPVIFLFLAGRPLELIHVPREWLVEPDTADARFFGSRLVGSAMLLGVMLAILSAPSTVRDAARTFFEGAGYAFANIIAVIVAATCFGKSVELIGLAELLGRLIDFIPTLMLPAAGCLTLAFAFLCGSGMASTQSLYPLFVEPANSVNVDLRLLGAVVSIAAAAGRSMSPVATVTLMCANMTGSDPVALVRRVWLPLLISMTVVLGVALFL